MMDGLPSGASACGAASSRSYARAPVRRVGFLEVCCDGNSEFSLQCATYGLVGERIAAVDNFHSTAGYNNALEFIRSMDEVHVWGALSCTSWCSV